MPFGYYCWVFRRYAGSLSSRTDEACFVDLRNTLLGWDSYIFQLWWFVGREWRVEGGKVGAPYGWANPVHGTCGPPRDLFVELLLRQASSLLVGAG